MANRFRLQVRIQLYNADNNPSSAYGGVSFEEQGEIVCKDFKELAEVMEAFHVLTEKFKETKK